MPVHVPAPTRPTDRCPKCGTKGVVQQSVGNMTTYACPSCGARWVATR
ncbi:MAG TPA: zf-TFIIB domain-containing protein [Anaeromyxobacteraceae bacterium]|nr:zf-TFIIB domain-containing protein [Anaeromyxobacteraceae bacterium]